MYSFLLKKEVNEKSVSPGYFLYGEETFLAHQFIQELKQALILPDWQDFNVEKFDLDSQSWMEVVDAARTIPVFFSSLRMIIVQIPKEKGEELNASEQKILKDYFTSLPSPQTVLIILFPDRLARNSPLLQFFTSLPPASASVKELKPLKGDRLSSWIDQQFHKAGKIITPEAKARLVELVGRNLWSLNSETEKILTFADRKEKIEAEDIEQATGLIKSFFNWELTDSLEKADFRKCLTVLDNLFHKEGILPVLILGTIGKFFGDLLSAKLLLKEKAKDRLEVFRMFRPKTPWKFREFFALVESLSFRELHHYLTELGKIDLSFKTSGLPLQPLLEGFLFDYCRRRPV